MFKKWWRSRNARYFLLLFVFVVFVGGNIEWQRLPWGMGKENVFCHPRVIFEKTFVCVEIADTTALRAKGLSGREELEEGYGMFFDFQTQRTPGMWMKDMRFGLDFVWINQDLVVVGITENVAPDTYPETFFPPEPIRYVLEVPSGWIQDHGIAVGDRASLSF